MPPTPDPRAQLTDEVRQILGVTPEVAAGIVTAFDVVVARPLEANLAKKTVLDLARRNPLIYTTRGVTTVEDWIDRALEDWETSAIEGHIGTWMEEVARIVSGGIKPGSGVDLQIERDGPPPVTELYAIQTSGNTKSSGGGESDQRALQRAARPLLTARRHVELYVAVLQGRRRTAPIGESGILKLGSEVAWEKLSGIPNFRDRLLIASPHLATLVSGRAEGEVSRIKEEAKALFGDSQGNLRLDVLANPPSARTLKKGHRSQSE